jgi:hypothetical protein
MFFQNKWFKSALALGLGLGFLISSLPGQSAALPGLAPESEDARSARHRKIAERRSGPMIMVHRGASAMAPENSLEAYAAAMDYGADGCEIDLRRTRDGVLVLFHDDMLDRLLDTIGAINEVDFDELRRIPPRLRDGRVLSCSGPPTFAAVLELARQRAMLLHLDVKEPGLETSIAQALDQADAWDHVVAVNTDHAPALAQNPKLKLCEYKAGLFEHRRDLDPEQVQAARPGKGQMVIVDDPRIIARVLGRAAYQPVNLTPQLCQLNPAPDPSLAPRADPTNFNLHAYFVSFGSRQTIRDPKGSPGAAPRAEPGLRMAETNATPEQPSVQAIVERAWLARHLGTKNKSAETVAVLEGQVWRRSLHPDWRYHGLDGAMAVRSLVQLHSVKSVPIFIAAFQRLDPGLKQFNDGQWADYPLAWRDHHFKMTLIPALGELPCPESKAFLIEYLRLPESAARNLAPPQFEDATKALLRQKLDRDEIISLLRHPKGVVRGTAIMECLDRPNSARKQALKEAAPWALELPPARPGKLARDNSRPGA